MRSFDSTFSTHCRSMVHHGKLKERRNQTLQKRLMCKRYEEKYSLFAVEASRTHFSAASQPKSIQVTCFKLCSCVSSDAIDNLVRRDDDMGLLHLLPAVCWPPWSSYTELVEPKKRLWTKRHRENWHVAQSSQHSGNRSEYRIRMIQ